MLSPDLPKAMEKSSPAPSTGADLPLSRKGSARSFRHWGGERMTRSSTFDDLVCDFLEEEDAKEEATAPLNSAPGSDNELKNGGDMLLGRTDSGPARAQEEPKHVRLERRILRCHDDRVCDDVGDRQRGR